jgi:two-component system, NarL family, response regulator NreC
MSVTIVLADDHHVMRQGLRLVLEAQEHFHVVAEAGNGLDTITLVERFNPCVLIVDVMMPGLNGLEVTRQVRQRASRTRVIVLSMYSNEAYVLEALRHGASGYVLKDAPADDLVHAVYEVVAGRRYHKAQDTVLNPYETLTTREREVLQLAAEGRTNGDIAAALYISPRTVETHRANVMRKLGLQNQADLIRYALQRGLLPMER